MARLGAWRERLRQQRIYRESERRLIARIHGYAALDSGGWLLMFQHVAGDLNHNLAERQRRAQLMLDARLPELRRRVGDKTLTDQERARYALEAHWLRYEAMNLARAST